MKKSMMLIVSILLSLTILAQTPQSFRYQAVARDNSGNVLDNQLVSFRISILSGSVSGAVAYSETHTGLTTNAFGLVELEIGKGTPLTGTFSVINWGSTSYFVKVEMDPAGGSDYQTLSTSQLLSVPYALHSKTVETGDNWGSQAVVPDATLGGNGTSATPLRIADGGVTSAKILDGNVTTNDLANNAVTTLKIADGSIATADLANSTVTTDKLGDLAVSTAKILNGAVTSDKLGGNSVIDTKIASGAVTSTKLASMGAASGQVLTWSGTAWAPQALPVVTQPWLETGSDIYFMEGKVGVGKNPTASFRNFQSETTDMIAIAAVNNSTNYAAIFGENLGTGPAADFRDNIRIIDGTQGTGKVLTSDAGGLSSWQPISISADESYFSGNGSPSSPLKLSSMGASAGQALKWNGTTWVPATDIVGNDFSLPVDKTVNTADAAFKITNTSSQTSGGIYGISQSPTGFGIYGESPNSGILGKATSTSNYNYGVRGESGSVQGVGVYGEASSATGPTCGVIGRSVSSDGKGILGYGYSSTGINYGVYGYSNSPSGYGIYGYSPNNGIYGEATAANNSANAGVTGKTASAYGFGVHGIASSTTGSNFGVKGESSSGTGYGVLGEAPGTGVRGTATASNGFGLVGYASSSTGSTAGVYAQVNSAGGFSGYFTGGKFYVNGRAGIGTESPSAGLHLKGSGFPESFMYLEANAGQDAGFRLYEGSTARWHIFNSAAAAGLQIYNTGGFTSIFCQQSTSNVGIGTTTPGYKLQVGNAGDGTQARANAWNLLSDARLKTDFRPLINPLEMVEKINGYYFYWNTGTDKNRQVGFSAQEVQEVIPEVVSKGEDGYLSIEYGKIAPLLIEAIKELKAENKRLKSEYEKLSSENAIVSDRLKKIEELMGITTSKKSENPVDASNDLEMKLNDEP